MNRAHTRDFLARCASGELDLMNPAIVQRLEATCEHLDADDEELAHLASDAAERMMRVTLESWAASMDLVVTERVDPATEIQALRAIGRARAG